MKRSGLKFIIALFVGISLYIAVVGTVHHLTSNVLSVNDYLLSIARFAITGTAMSLCIGYLLLTFKKLKYSLNDALSAVMYAVLAQAVFALLAFVFPPVKDFFIFLLQMYSDNAAIHNPWAVEYRLFGFATDMFDHFGHGIGILSAIPVILAYRTKQIRYLAYLPLILVPVVLNARTGILIAAIIVLPLLVYSVVRLVKNRKLYQMKKYILAGASVLVASSVFVGALAFFIPEKVTDGIRDVQSLVQVVTTGEVPTYTSTGMHLFDSDFWKLPQSAPAIIFGEGHSVYGVSGYAHSDVGYVNDIWVFGILGAIVMYAGMVYFTLKIRKYGTFYLILAISLIVSLFIFQIKGAAFWSANLGIMAHVLMCTIFLYYFSANEKKSNADKRSD